MFVLLFEVSLKLVWSFKPHGEVPSTNLVIRSKYVHEKYLIKPKRWWFLRQGLHCGFESHRINKKKDLVEWKIILIFVKKLEVRGTDIYLMVGLVGPPETREKNKI